MMLAPGGSAMTTGADALLADVKAMIAARTGLAFCPDRKDGAGEKIGARMSALGLARYVDYLAVLADPSQAREWDALIEEITIGETFFFRYPAQWDALRDVVIPERSAGPADKPLKVLCAGCANGAEPYSLSILLRLDLGRQHVGILGADISKARLAQAESGVYGAWELRATPARYRDCFEPHGKSWRLKETFREGVDFMALNLVEEGAAFATRYKGEFDVILCRNVMIYFSAETNRQLLKNFHACLKDGGWFIAGHAEPYLEISNVFRPEPASGAMLYRKLDAARAGAARIDARPLPPLRRPASAPLPAARRAPSRAPAIAPAPLERTEQPPGNLDAVRRLANAGAWPEAIALCERLAASDPLNPEIHFLAALTFAHTGDGAAQEAALKRAVYLDPNFAFAHYHLALASVARGAAADAARSLRNVLASLETADDAAPVACGDGLTAGGLRQLAGLRFAGGDAP